MELEEIRKTIEDSKRFLEDYKSYGQMVTDAINSLDRIDELVADPSDENLSEALDITKELNSQMGPYKAYVPILSEAIDKLLKCLQEKTV